MDKELFKGLELEARFEDHQYQDLYGDFVFVVELNRELSMKYQELMNCFPKVAELDLIIKDIEESSAEQINYKEDMNFKELNERLQKLKKFRSALVMIEKDDPRMKPPRYDEIDRDNSSDDVEVFYDD